MDNRITPGEIVAMAAGGVALIASFLPFFDPDFGDSTNAWGEGLFPIATLIMLYVVAVGVLVVLDKFANVRLNVLGFGLVQLMLALAAGAVLLALAFLIVDIGPGQDRGFGFWLLLLASIASVVGAVLVMNERRGAMPGPGPGPGTV